MLLSEEEGSKRCMDLLNHASEIKKLLDAEGPAESDTGSSQGTNVFFFFFLPVHVFASTFDQTSHIFIPLQPPIATLCHFTPLHSYHSLLCFVPS